MPCYFGARRIKGLEQIDLPLKDYSRDLGRYPRNIPRSRKRSWGIYMYPCRASLIRGTVRRRLWRRVAVAFAM